RPGGGHEDRRADTQRRQREGVEGDPRVGEALRRGHSVRLLPFPLSPFPPSPPKKALQPQHYLAFHLRPHPHNTPEANTNRGGPTRCDGPRLHSFEGNSTKMTPKARINTILGYTAP